MSKITISDEEIEIARKAIEDVLIERRDARFSMFRNNGLCVNEADGEPSPVIRMSTESAIAIAVNAINRHRGYESNRMRY